MTTSLLPRFKPYVIRKTWHYGQDYRVTQHSGPFIADALISAAPDMPEPFWGDALGALRNHVPYDGWSWMTLELVTY